MTTHLVTFSDSSMSRSAELCVESAHRNGIWTHSRFTPNNIRHWAVTAETVKANETVFSQLRGCGLWAWKPLLIYGTMQEGLVADGSFIVYADAGIEFINNVNYIIDRVDHIFLFGNQYEHAHWCKRDIVEAIWPLEPGFQGVISEVVTRAEYGLDYNDLNWSRFGKQVQASVIFFRVSDHTRAFVKEWLDWCLFEGGRLIDDSPSITPNHPEFRENRHDQAILTTMAYRDGLRLHYWPAQYNDGAFTYERGDYPDEGYPILFHHHRRRNHEWENAA